MVYIDKPLVLRTDYRYEKCTYHTCFWNTTTGSKMRLQLHIGIIIIHLLGGKSRLAEHEEPKATNRV